jgi:hypothetical protein
MDELASHLTLARITKVTIERRHKWLVNGGEEEGCCGCGISVVLCHPRLKGKVAWETEKFSSIQRSQNPLFSTVNVPFIVFLCSPSSRKSRDKISFKGGEM